MATKLFSNSLKPSFSRSTTSEWICQSCRRHQSTFRRTRKALRVKPDSSFLPTTTEAADHIIFNPPSSAPSVYHTPPKFLPVGDPRRKLHSLIAQRRASLSTASMSTAGAQTNVQGPTLRTVTQKKYHLTQTQIDEVRRLRKEDPRKWTRVRLAEEFDCSEFFISLCCSAPEIAKEKRAELEQIKSRWGRSKTEAREERKERKKLWGKA